MNDLTIIYYTRNKTPEKWRKYHLNYLINAIDNRPLITVSREPVNLGINIIDKEIPCYANIYRQLLRAAKIADTEYVATAEDDCLYSKEHYKEFRPKENEFAYNHARWSVFAWEKDRAIYCLRQRVSNCSLIAPRKLLIEALEERFSKFKDDEEISNSLMGECGRHKLEKRLGITLRNMVLWWSTCPIIHLNHKEGTDDRQTAMYKLHGQLKAKEIPYWGKASYIANQYQ